MSVTENGFVRMTQILMEIAQATAKGKMAVTLEGGYDVSAQSRSVKSVLKELAQVSPADRDDLLEREKASYPRIERGIEQIKGIQRRYWKSL